MTTTQQQRAAEAFAARWQGKGYEKGDSQIFWTTLLAEVFGVEHVDEWLHFEQQVRLDHTSFIDAYIPRTHVMIEQKSIEKDLGTPIKQSDGSLLNPFQQAKRYAAELPYSQRPRWIVTCNFREFWVYDMEQPNGEPQKIALANLGKEYYRLQFLVDEGNEHLKREMEVSVKAGELVGVIYDKLLEQYGVVESQKSKVESLITDDILRSLNILCVRLVFCLYAEDSGLFQSKTAFHDYLAQFQPKHIRKALIDLFEVLDTPLNERDPYLDEDLAAFPYVNGGLFGESRDAAPHLNDLNDCEDKNRFNRSNARGARPIIIPQFTDELKQLLLDKASADFDWSEISPTIFGAVFESTLNPETRRSGGMHYTSIENIHKVIDPLFLDDLRAEFEGIVENVSKHSGTNTNDRNRSPLSPATRQALAAFQDKLASHTFFDPACGSGNFLTETYLSLRRLENEVIRAMYGGANILTFDTLIKVHISQFYGIEINDFACTVAKTALWIAENQMMQQTSAIAGKAMDFLPLKTNANIVEGNALRMDWGRLFGQQLPTINQQLEQENNCGIIDDNCGQINYPDYIIGNPPFVGYSLQSKEQKEEMLSIYVDEKGKPYKTAGKIDYVAAWYWKAAELMRVAQGTHSSPSAAAANTPAKHVRAALVSTNSITQGEQVAAIWQPLFERFGLQIDFAYRTFRWDSEADIKAHVHCVIIGFSVGTHSSPSAVSNYTDTIGIPKGYEKKIYLSDNQVIQAANINPYLIDAQNVWIESRNKPLCDVPEMIYGSKPTDGGFLFLKEDEYNEIITREPEIAKYIKRIYGSEEFINNKMRYCLWLVGVSPAEIRKSPFLLDRINKVREYRLASPKAATRESANTAWLFQEVRYSQSDYIVIPRVSSERRRYVPIGFLLPDIMVNDAMQFIPSATLYHFGVLTSNVHMAWMRVVCGRLKSDYRYSKDIVYNNFPWCQPTDEQKTKIEQTAQAILDARAKYPDSSLADLYDEVTMPPELRKAHQDNDRAVMAAYGFSPKMTESECVAELFRMYQQLTQK